MSRLVENTTLSVPCCQKWSDVFCEFLDGLEFGDHLGLVTYATYSKIQPGLNDQFTEA